MEFEVSYSLDNEQQFWDELDDIVSTQCATHELIDNSLRAYLAFTTKFRDEYLNSDAALEHCSSKVLQAPLFTSNQEYVRRQLVYGLLQEDDAPTLHIIAAFLLLDGRAHVEVFEMMREEGIFPRLIELIKAPAPREDAALHEMLLELAYEMSRIQRLSWQDLMSVDDGLVLFLFQIIEELSYDVNDSYHYPVIRFLLVLNEQYMVHSTADMPLARTLPNRVLKALATHGHQYKTFGENIILLLNRESETSQQLLILKLLYLLFSSHTTAEYFYTNDLHVLIDVILRNLVDLPPDDAPIANGIGVTAAHDSSASNGNRTTPVAALRHTYLRVLHPLLANSQVHRPGSHYKRDETIRLLHALGGEGGTGIHFAPADPTTVRLVQRCLSVGWLRDEEHEPCHGDMSRKGSMAGSEIGDGRGEREVAQRMLGMNVHGAGESALSFVEVAGQTEKPGILTPRRGGDRAHG
jgi:hypothetical protein